MFDAQTEIAKDVDAVGRIDALSTLLQVVRDITGMRFAAVARVTDKTWTVCAIQDDLSMGLTPGSQLDIETTLCREVRMSRAPIVIEHASVDPVYKDHHTPKLYHFESYISVPILAMDGEYFGNLCALDPLPIKVAEARILSMFSRFAQLIGNHLDLKKLHERAAAELSEEKAAVDQRDQFITLLGHDLRGPAQIIQAAADQLALRTWDPGLLALSSRLKQGVHRMSQVIGDILDFARGRPGAGMLAQKTPVEDLEQRLEAVVAEIASTESPRKIVSNIAIGTTVHCDPERLRQLATTLLENAVAQAAPLGAVSFIASVDEGDLVIQVWNGGEPIPPAELSHMFAPLWRFTTPDQASIGLGLHSCWQIARTHGGRISVTSTKKYGTQFTVRLPVAPPV